MKYLLEDLIINRVDLVDEGANSAAFIELFKRKEHSDKMELKDIIEKLAPEHASVVQAELTRLTDEVAKGKESLIEAVAERDKAISKASEVDKANEDLANAKSELEALKDSAAKDDEEVMKAMPENVREMFSKMKVQKEAAEEAVRKAKENEAHVEAVAKAAELKALPVEQAKLVDILKSASPELVEVLKSISAAVEGTVLGEVGKSKNSDTKSGSDAWDKIEVKAEEIAKASNVSKAKAISMAVDQNPELYKEYLKGGAN